MFNFKMFGLGILVVAMALSTLWGALVATSSVFAKDRPAYGYSNKPEKPDKCNNYGYSNHKNCF